jgi:glycosyltransferase involved in cell wall biosynthesis
MMTKVGGGRNAQAKLCEGRGVRICLVYDCLFPYTVGGAERWYRELGERLAASGHEVTYLTLRQWERGEAPDVPGMRVLAVGPRLELYSGARRRILPPLVFGAGVLQHLFRHGRRYDVVHAASFPYFSLLAAGLAQRRHRFRLVVDWFEVWTRRYWKEYLGPLGGHVGWRIQRLCTRFGDQSFSFSRLHADRLRVEGFRGPVTVLEGLHSGNLEPGAPRPAELVVVFAGRHIPEKRVPALVQALPRARERVPELRAELYGDGPERAQVLRLVSELGLADAVAAPGFVPAERVEKALARALCLVLPSSREGYGLVVVEAAARGVPSVVVAGPDNAAVELVDEEENGFIAASAGKDDLAAAIVRVHEAGPVLRNSTAEWFQRNAHRLSLDGSLAAVLESYSQSEPRV